MEHTDPSARTAAPGAVRTGRAWVWRLPALLAAACLTLLVARLPRMVEAITWNADALAPGLIAERAADPVAALPDGGTTVLGDISSASTLWFSLLTSGIPGHRAIWEYAPAVLALCTALLVGWSCWRLAGRWAGLLGGSLVLVAGPDVLLTFLAPAFRGPTWFSAALLAAVLVAWALRAGRPIGSSVALAVVAAAVVGVNLASDPLLALAGAGPLVAAPLLIWWYRRTDVARRVLFLALGTGAGIGAMWAGAHWLLGVGGYVTRRQQFGGGYMRVARAEDVLEHVPLLGKSVLALAGAPDMGGQVQGIAPLRWSLALVVVAGLAVALWPGRGGDRARARAASGGVDLARALYLAFWGLAAAGVMLGYLFSDIPSGSVTVSVPGNRYLVPVILAAVATLPIVLHGPGAARARRIGAGAASLALVAGAAVALANGDLVDAQRSEITSRADEIAAWLDEQGVDRGYAGYWSAGPLSYHTGLRVLAVRPCLSGARETLCPVALNGRREWYMPAAEIGSFVLVDVARPGDALFGGGWRAGFGRPAVTRRFGTAVVRVYPYDVAQRLAPGWRPYPDERLAARAASTE